MIPPHLSRKAALFILAAVTLYAVFLILNSPLFQTRHVALPSERFPLSTVQRGIAVRVDAGDAGDAAGIPLPVFHRAGVNWVSLSMDVWMPGPRNGRLEYSALELDRLRDLALQLKGSGLGVTLAPQLAFRGDGESGSPSSAESGPARERATAYLEEIADIARTSGADAICIPWKLLEAFEQAEDAGRMLAKIARASGAHLTASVDWTDQHDASAFGDLDYLTVRSSQSPSSPGSGDSVASVLRSLARRVHKHLVLDCVPPPAERPPIVPVFHLGWRSSTTDPAFLAQTAAASAAEPWMLGAFVPSRMEVRPEGNARLLLDNLSTRALRRLESTAGERSLGKQLELRQSPPAADSK